MAGYLEKLDSVFWITLATLIIGFLGVVLRYCFKSKCSRVSCCGIIIERDVAGELEEQRIENRFPSRVGSVENNVSV